MTVLDEKPYTFDRVVRMAIMAALLWGLVNLLSYLSDVLIPFAVALLMAYLINPLVVWVEARLGSRPVAVFLSLVLVFGSILGLALYFVPIIMNEFSTMGRLMSDFVGNSEVAARAARHLPPDLWASIKAFLSSDEVKSFFATDSFLSLLQATAKKLLPGLWGVISGTARLGAWVFGLFFILLYLVFLLIDFKAFKVQWKNFIPGEYREAVVEFTNAFEAGMNQYFRGQALVAGLVGVLMSIGFSIIGLPMAIVLGLFIGLLNMVPYLQIVGTVPAVFLAIVHALQSGQNLWTVLLMTGAVFGVVQLIQDAVLVPRILGKVMGMSPAMILLSLSIWGKLLGLLGLLIALPMTCLVVAYYRRIVPSVPMLDMETEIASEQEVKAEECDCETTPRSS
ncbi:AI-2E family transporter [Desulfovibrio inopinatus]|uniref:AI-2E family transporter n=1 Tax=Desulfovibrio inopinatus TaxID=102109 RepID=UPI0004288FDE|nr:AI-2E family transporter [Desulfovibrio inopinatus]